MATRFLWSEDIAPFRKRILVILDEKPNRGRDSGRDAVRAPDNINRHNEA